MLFPINAFMHNVVTDFLYVGKKYLKSENSNKIAISKARDVGAAITGLWFSFKNLSNKLGNSSLNYSKLVEIQHNWPSEKLTEGLVKRLSSSP